MIRSEFATNDGDERVSDAIASHLEYLLETWAKPFEVAIASAYFNPGGYGLLANALDRIGRVRLLLGVSPASIERRVRKLTGADGQSGHDAALRDALGAHLHSIEEDRDLLGFEPHTDSLTQRLVSWLRSGNIEVRRLEDAFLHGKAFVVVTDDEGVIAGSSNFTYAGLARNRELNLGHYQPHVVRLVNEWFEKQWSEAKPFDLAAIYEGRFLAHSPHEIYVRMLYERYGTEVEEEGRDEGGIHLTQFQRDGLWRARRLLSERHGVLIADGVGLGKTFIAGEMIREAVEERRQRVLVVAPAALRDGPWAKFLNYYRIGGAECVSYEQLSQDMQLNQAAKGSHLRNAISDYALIVVDEAHAYRNPDTLRAQVLRQLLEGTPPRDLVLLTATPVNNSLWDLYYLLGFYIRNDAAFAAKGIRSLRDHFAEAVALDPSDLTPEKLFDVLDAVAVRRTRHFVKRYYPHDYVEIRGVRVPITFPEPTVVPVRYDLESELPGFFPKLEHALTCGDGACDHPSPLADEPTLKLARHTPSRYARTGPADSHELQLVGLLGSGLLKRFESSAHAFTGTCERMVRGHDAFLDLLDRGFVATADQLEDWSATESDEMDTTLARLRLTGRPASAFRLGELRRDVIADREILRHFADAAGRVTPERDRKLSALQEQLVEIARQAHEEAHSDQDERNRRKVIIFSYFADTVRWVAAHLETLVQHSENLAAYRDRLVWVTGDEGNRPQALFGFAPETTDAPPETRDSYDILITTDALSEGVNLQQARHVINYDLPWNPMKLVQRHGRIDRIGSMHDRVWIRCIMPDQQLERILELEERLQRKIAQAAKSIGVEGEVLPGSRIGEVNLSETRDEIDRLRAGDTSLFETAGERANAHSGEEYRQELRAALEIPDVAEAVRRLPWGSGSGFERAGADRGFVFCARVGDYPTPQFRYVRMDATRVAETVGDTLTAFANAHADAATARVLSEQTHRQAYDAWGAARKDIFDVWNESTDLRSLLPVIPKAMRDAAELLRSSPPVDLPQSGVDRVIDAIEAPYGPRVQQAIRDALRISSDPREQAAMLVDTVNKLGLRPAVPPEALPPITIDDIHLVCWIAIVPPRSTDERASAS